MLSRGSLEKIIRKAITVIIVLIVLLLLAYGVSKSSFNNIKKYNETDDSKRLEMPMSDAKEKMAKERRFSTKVVITEGENMANLGDFEMNIQGNKKLTMNMSLKFKNTGKDNWFSSKDVKKEIVKKGVVLRSSVIDVLSHHNNTNVNNDKMKTSLINNMNKYLSDGEVEEVYFNEYITHEN